jgi:hypothetical protein
MGAPLDSLRITYEVTDEPWELPVDAIVLSVSYTLSSAVRA